VSGDRESGACLAKFAWTKVVRHTLVKGRSSSDDPALVQYWVDRRRKGPPLPVGRTSLHLLFVQRWRCPFCQALLLHVDRPPQSPQEWEQWLAATRKAIAKSYLTVREDGTPDEHTLRLVHTQCQRRHVRASTRSNHAEALPDLQLTRFDPASPSSVGHRPAYDMTVGQLSDRRGSCDLRGE